MAELLALGADTSRTWFGMTATTAFGSVDRPKSLSQMADAVRPFARGANLAANMPKPAAYRLASGRTARGERRARLTLLKGT